MRIIKFKAQNKRTKEWKVFVLPNDLFIAREDEMFDYENYRQFTGLLDKNGKEIYEGDIVREEQEWQEKEDKRQIEVVTYKKYMDCCVTGIGFGFGEQGSPLSHERVVVIGNIYENPDLLKP